MGLALVRTDWSWKDRGPKDWPELSFGTFVITGPKALANDYTADGIKARRWEASGRIVDYSKSHGLCYGVEHRDGVVAWYDREEFEVILRDEEGFGDDERGRGKEKHDMTLSDHEFTAFDGTRMMHCPRCAFPRARLGHGEYRTCTNCKIGMQAFANGLYAWEVEDEKPEFEHYRANRFFGSKHYPNMLRRVINAIFNPEF